MCFVALIFGPLCFAFVCKKMYQRIPTPSSFCSLLKKKNVWMSCFSLNLSHQTLVVLHTCKFSAAFLRPSHPVHLSFVTTSFVWNLLFSVSDLLVRKDLWQNAIRDRFYCKNSNSSSVETLFACCRYCKVLPPHSFAGGRFSAKFPFLLLNIYPS